MSQVSEPGIASPTSYCTTPASTDSESSPESSRDGSRAASPALGNGTPLERQPTSSSIASSFFSRLTISSPRSDPFEAYEADKRKRERKQQKQVEKRIREFHGAVTGAVFIGTIVHYTPHDFHTASDSLDIEGSHASNTARRSTEGTYSVGVTNIVPKEPPPPKSTRAQHYETFTTYYNDTRHEPLECFFDVFMKTAPREGARVSFIVTPTGEDDAYVAVACNVVDRYTPMRVDSSCKGSEVSAEVGPKSV
jgi:hypothetical protein